MATVQTLPHWNMAVVYPGLDTPEFAGGFARVVEDIAQLAQFFDTRYIMEQAPQPLSAELIHAFEAVVERYNHVLDTTKTLSTYLNCLVSTNSYDDAAQARSSELRLSLVLLSQLGTRFTAWIGSLDVEALIEQSPVAQDHAYMLRKTAIQAKHLMSPAEETLSAELNLSGGTAWARLHSDLTSQLTVSLELEGRVQDLPMSMVRNLAFDSERDTRRRAYEAELVGWKRVALPLAAALNSIKGEVNIVTARRGWESPLDASLFVNSIDRQTLDAMFAAARASFPDFRRYLRAKARLLGVGERLPWYDLFAPLGKSSRVWDFGEAESFIVEQFGSYSSRMANFAARAFHEQWIDAEPRYGKGDGAYCASLRGDESRVCANYKPTFRGVSTLAHELGHGYHNMNLASRTMLQRTTPMALAETASIFCETIIRQAAMREGSGLENLALLDASLQGACQLVVDITSRFLFEQRLFEARQRRELSVEELNTLMLETQRETYGDGLEDATLHPYMWAVKQHYYSTGRSFYNYPYMFGLLFGLGLYARYQQDPDAFKVGYDHLLSSTGMADAPTLAARFGIDIRTEEFWHTSLDTVRREVEQFEALVDSMS
ncbi:MAG: M3 family oligoendopeptidase [Chloroflexota bacterium]|nr:M3 family oligoendopeptidase [Chloroflexota bacterium]